MAMSEPEVLNKVKEALDAFFRADISLLNVNASERSIAHKLAQHLQRQFDEFNVDCEYNRHGSAIKRLNSHDDRAAVIDPSSGSPVLPDIVVHSRGDDRRNLLIIEIKKSNSRELREKDLKKLKNFTSSPYRYRHGLFLLFDIEGKRLSDVLHFSSGEEVEKELWAGLKELGYAR